MTANVSGNHYYQLDTITQQDYSGRRDISTILLKPTKVDNAETFLKDLHRHIRGNSTINLPEGTTLNKIVDGVVLGYQSKLNKLGIPQRIWQRFATIITYPLKLLGINLTQAQKIQYYAKIIKNSAENQSILLSSDPAFDLKNKLIRDLPIDSPERTKILSYSTEQCLEKMTNNPEDKFLSCRCYLMSGDIEKARELFLGLNKEDEPSIESYFPEAIFACIERGICANDLIEKMFALSEYGISNEKLDGIVSKCGETGKLEQLTIAIDASSINKNYKEIFYDAVVRECLKKIDLNELASRSGEPKEQTSSEKLVKILHCVLDKISFQHAFELAKLFIAIEDYSAAIQAANLIYYNEIGQALLVEISSLCTKKGQFKLALGSLKKISFMDKIPSIVKALVDLVNASIEVDLDFAYNILKDFKYKSGSPMKKELNDPAILLFERAMTINNFRMAIDALSITLGNVLDDLSMQRLMRLLAACPKDFNTGASYPLAKEIANLLPVEGREKIVDQFILNKEYESAFFAIHYKMSPLSKFNCLMQIFHAGMAAEKYDLAYESLRKMHWPVETKAINEEAFNEMLNELIETGLQKQLYLPTFTALYLVSYKNRMDKKFIDAVDAFFSSGIKNNQYSLAIAAIGTLLFKIEGQDLKELYQHALERLSEISPLVESDEALRKLVAYDIANYETLLDIQDA
jgi:hypothetical protein